MARDIVQFVEFRKYRGRGQESRLAKEVVAEIPDQILSYAKAHNIAPQPPRQYSDHVRPVSGPAAVSYGAAAEEVRGSAARHPSTWSARRSSSCDCSVRADSPQQARHDVYVVANAFASSRVGGE